MLCDPESHLSLTSQLSNTNRLIKKTKKHRANSCDEFCKGILDKEDDYNDSDNQYNI